VPGWTFNLAHGRSHLLDILSIRVGADVARFVPSATRSRLATHLWPVSTVLILALIWRFRRFALGRQTALWGVTVALLLPAGLVWSAQNRTTHIVEFEDPWLGQEEGAVHPDLWVVYRPRYRGGWTLYDRSTIPLPVNPGGALLDLEIAFRLAPENGVRGILELADGSGRILKRATSDRFGEWGTMRIRDVPWPAGDTLTLTFRGPDDPLAVAAYSAILDRARLTWR
jgi:hypothetical protein